MEEWEVDVTIRVSVNANNRRGAKNKAVKKLKDVKMGIGPIPTWSIVPEKHNGRTFPYLYEVVGRKKKP